MQAHSVLERSVWYALLIMPGILPGHRLTTPFQTVSGWCSRKLGQLESTEGLFGFDHSLGLS
jgi:hypothetical protein